VLGAATIGLAILHFGFPPPPPATLRFQVSPPSSVQSQDSPRISPDGRTLAYNATDSTGTSRIWIRPLGVLDAQAFPGTDGAKRPFWSPDSKYLGFIANGKLKKVSVAGGPPTVICDAPTGADGAWSSKDVILFDGSVQDPIFKVAATGGIATPVVMADSSTGSTQVGWPEFLPDGRHFLYLAITPQSILRVGDLESKLRKDLGPCESQAQYLAPGRILYSRGGSLVVQRFDTGGLKFTGEPVPVAEQVGASSVGGADFRASNNGVLVYSTRLADSGELAELDRMGRLVKLLTVPPYGLYPSLSPDERRVAFRALDPTSRTRDIWIVDRMRNLSTRFTFEKSDEFTPMWSPDGRRIAYAGTGNTPGIWVKDLTGSGATDLVYPTKEDVSLTCWSRDGSRIFFGVRGASTSDIWTLAMDGSGKAQPFLNAPYNESEGRLSPDGRYLAYVSDESGREEVYVQPFPDRSDKWQVSTGGGNDPEWNGDGSELYYLSPGLEMMAVPTGTKQAFDPGTPQRLFTTSVLFPGGQRKHYTVTRDGQTFIVYRTASARTIPTTTVVVNWTEGLPKR
jgi:Tol biopolymer transport system component